MELLGKVELGISLLVIWDVTNRSKSGRAENSRDDFGKEPKCSATSG